MNVPTTWSAQDAAMASAPHDDFQFLDLGMTNLGDEISFEFAEFGAQENGNGQMMHHNRGDAMDTSGMDGDMAMLNHKEQMLQSSMLPSTSTSGHSTIASTPIEVPQNNSLVELDAQIQYLQQQRLQQQQRQIQEQQRNYYVQHGMVPPTPNSAEMHGSARFYSQADQQSTMYERFQLRLKEQDMAFTPLVSPAVTPLDAHFNIPEYTVPGAYFSPLSSPALHAQNEHRSVYDTRHLDASSTPSPNEMSLESSSLPTSAGPTAKKAAKKPAPKSRTPRTTARGVRQSPITKPQRKRTGSTVISQQILTELQEPVAAIVSSAVSSASTEDSNDSVSPEHLSDMAPPPLPGSANRSPFLTGQKNQTNQSYTSNQNGKPRVQQAANGLSPATPASLMRIVKTSQVSPSLESGNLDDHPMDGFALPEAAHSPRPIPSRLDTHSDGQTTPTLESAARTPGMTPLPSPAFVRPTIAASVTSPQITSLNGSTNGTSAARKTPQFGPRGSKKRSSVTPVHVSPALRPKISPSIKPLIRGGSSVSDDTASLLLASKSNYQNILEGTHLPGVSYPTELSTNLTSKRTSHKIAEQGRRNRINSALQEMSALLPKDGEEKSSSNESGPGDAKDGSEEGGGGSGKSNSAGGGGGGAGGGAQSANSKASTVEMAIVYIKHLEKKIAEANRRAEESENRLKEMKRLETGT